MRNLSEQLQENLITFLDGMDQQIIDGVCDIVVNTIKEQSNEKLEEIAQDIRNLRDADFHVCPADTDDFDECTCEHFDRVTDKVEALIK